MDGKNTKDQCPICGDHDICLILEEFSYRKNVNGEITQGERLLLKCNSCGEKYTSTHIDELNMILLGITTKESLITPDKARRNVVESFDLQEALELIEQESKKGKLQCRFKKGNSAEKVLAIDYMNGLKALGYHCEPATGPYDLYISWEKSYPSYWVV